MALAPLVGIGAIVSITGWLFVTSAWVTALAGGSSFLVLPVATSVAAGGLYIVSTRMPRRYVYQAELPEPPEIGELARRINEALEVPEREVRLIRRLRLNPQLKLTRRVSLYAVIATTVAAWSWTLYATVELGLPPTATRLLAASAALAAYVVGVCWRRALTGRVAREVSSRLDG